jgi:hypothetical protein
MLTSFEDALDPNRGVNRESEQVGYVVVVVSL